jgi:hypothetical protein
MIACLLQRYLKDPVEPWLTYVRTLGGVGQDGESIMLPLYVVKAVERIHQLAGTFAPADTTVSEHAHLQRTTLMDQTANATFKRFLDEQKDNCALFREECKREWSIRSERRNILTEAVVAPAAVCATSPSSWYASLYIYIWL